ncbi:MULTISPECIES: hypothetical protein [unclassified Devosia]|uniref:hypothetical protein n=1 Tax=unclassified Devosia TaxID=196773 RepID=UPI0015527D24|nr:MULTISPECIES: hypothetical protein [unclassified Devosia]
MLTSKASAALLVTVLAGSLTLSPLVVGQDNATPATTQAAPEEPGGARRAIRWAQAHLQEMDAAITVLEQNTEQLAGDARTKAEAELDKLRAVREEYQRSLEEALATTDARTREETERLGSALATHWDDFETDLAAYYDAAKADHELRRAVFIARAEAQEAAFRQEIEDLDHSVANAAAGAKTGLDARKAALEARLQESREQLDRLGAATDASWQQFVDGLHNARTAFQAEFEKHQ